VTKKPTLKEVKDFWEAQSTGGVGGRYGAHSDQHVTHLETWYVTKYALEKYGPDELIDVGCGNGDRTKLFSEHVRKRTLGLDYSEGMIQVAKKKETSRLKFQRADLLKEPAMPFVPDMIVSCRCLINLGTQANVIRTIRYFHRALPIGGKLVLCECSEEGHLKLNGLRSEMGLKEIQTAWHNINIDEQKLFTTMQDRFEVADLSRLGLYYMMTRVLHPAMVKPKDPDPDAEINALAAEIQEKTGVGVAEEYGRQLCLVATKLP
jgi:ubiquinone/menaquinone biosynthesis C-methylase UbiE